MLSVETDDLVVDWPLVVWVVEDALALVDDEFVVWELAALLTAAFCTKAAFFSSAES